MFVSNILRVKRLAFVAITTLLIVGCNDNKNKTQGQIHGIVATSPYGKAAIVCVDLDKNYRCGKNDPKTEPDASGRFEITSEPGLVVAEFYAEDDGEKPSNIMIGGAENDYFVSPLTTLLHVHAKKNGRSLSEAESDIRGRIKMPEEVQSLSENYDATGDKLSKGLAKVVSSYQSKRFALAPKPASKQLQVEVVEGFLSSAIDLSDAKALASLEEGDGGGEMGALPALSDLPIIQGMKLGAGYDVLSDRVKSAAQCVVSRGHDDIRKVKVIGRNDVRYEYQLITKREDLIDFLDINANIGVSGNDFDVSVTFKLLKEYERHSNKIYAAVKVDARVADVHIENPAMVDSAGLLFTSNYEGFRKICGDQFLNVITVGGIYYGLIEMSAKTLEDKLNIEAGLDVKVESGSTKVDVGFDMILRKAFNAAGQDVKVTIHSAGAPSGYQPVTDFTSFILDVGHFYCNLRGISQEDCEEICNQKLRSLEKQDRGLSALVDAVANTPAGDAELIDTTGADDDGFIEGPIKQAVYAKFEDYGQIFNTVRAAAIVEQNYNKRRMLDFYNDYYSLFEETDNMVNFPSIYEDMTDEAKEDIADLRGNLPVYLENLKLHLANCAHPINPICIELTNKTQVLENVFGVTVDPDDDLDDVKVFPAEIRATLPKVKEFLPRTCVDIRNKGLASSNTGDFVLYLRGDENRPFNVQCRNIYSENMVPEAYLLVDNRSVLQEDGFGKLVELPSYNYSIFKELPEAKMEKVTIVPEVTDAGVPEGDTETEVPQETLTPEELEQQEKGTLISAYKMIKVLINHDSLVIDPNQKEYTGTSAGGPAPGEDPAGESTVANHGPSALAEYRYQDDDNTYDLIGVYNHAPLGWTKICDRNYDIGSVIYDGEGILRTANIDLVGTPFVLSDNFIMETNTRFEPMYNAVSSYQAESNAIARGGKLLVLVNQEDADRFAETLQAIGFDGVWLNLKVLEMPFTDELILDWGVDVVQYNPFDEPLNPNWVDLCSYLSVVEDENGEVSGQVTMIDCEEPHQFFVEYSKADVGYDIGARRQTLDVFASHIYGECVTVYPLREMEIEYDTDIALELGLIDD